MTAAIARGLMALAVHCLGDRRRGWALAMEVEFEAAREDGRPFAFAFGCLLAAWRELAAHEEGRLAIAGHMLAFALVLPTAALLASTVLAEFPSSFLGPAGVQGLDGLLGEQKPRLSEANLSAVPALAVLIGALAASQLRLAWLMLERDWERVAATAMLIAAATVTLVILTSVVFDHYASALVQAAALGLELASVSALARWHGQLSPRTPAKAPG